MEDLWAQMPMDSWQYSTKKAKDCEIYLRKGGSNYSCYRLHTEFDFPPDLVMEYFRDIDKRMSWDEGFDYLKFVRTFRLNTMILHVKLKAQWPVGPREALLVF